MARKTKLFFCVLALCIFAMCTAYAEETTCTEHNYDYSTMQSDESYHWYACVNCGAPENQWPHEVSCSSTVQDTCTICGKTGVSCVQTHDYDLDNYQYDDTHHWAACTNCQAQVNNAEHALNCTTGVCDGCGQTGVSGYTSHSVTGEYEYDNDNHWQICSRCNEAVYTSHHGVHCDAVSDACVECGQTGVDIHVWHSYNWDDVVYDETEHWRICERCGVKTGNSTHYVRCSQADKTVCYECGAATSGDDVSHTADGDAPQYDDTYHWYVCTSCGEEVHKGTHWLSCLTGACGSCGQTGVNGDISHEVDWDGYEYDTTHHWVYCTDCGEQVDYGEHALSCQTGACEFCGASGVEGSVYHNVDWDSVEYTTTEHWRICLDCGEEVYRGEHHLGCTTGVCDGCGQSDVEGNVNHEIDWDLQEYDATHHWYPCVNCGERLNYAAHGVYCNTTDTACAECGQTGVELTTWHEYDFDNKLSDSEYHWIVCVHCGDETNRGTHYYTCAGEGSQSECAECGATGVSCSLTHQVNGSQPFEYDATHHWHTCESCGAQCHYYEHVLDCQTGICRTCDNGGVEGDVGHEVDWEAYEYDSDYHWNLCKNCGEVINHFEHGLSCVDGACRECGQTGVNGHTGHSYNWEDAQYTTTEHWHICLDCGEEVDRGEHWLSCVTGVCHGCGKSGVEGNTGHSYNWEDAQYTTTEHWHICLDCGEEVDRDEHWLDCATGSCHGCGQTGVEGNVTHECDWESYQYDTDYHWRQCVNCGTEIEKWEHTLSCTTGACLECGQSGVNGNTGHACDWEDAQYTATEHWTICQECGEEVYRGEHWLDCVTGECYGCGQSGVEGGVGHSYNWEDAQYTTTEHWYICLNCGEEVDRGEHWLDCQTGVCRGCGQSGVEGNVGHEYDWENIQYDEDYHWYLCVGCGLEMDKWEHSVACDTGACRECGQTGVIGYVSHQYSQEDAHYDETYHWFTCQACGEEVDKGEHWMFCTSDVCESCGQTGVEGYINHECDWDNPLYNETHHWYICLSCGEEADKSNHWPSCTTGVCNGCGLADAVGEPDHWINWNKAQYDADSHWYICQNCGEEVYKDIHWLHCQTGVCVTCGQSDVSGEVQHEMNWKSPEYDETNHWYVCTLCGESSEPGKHGYVCTESGDVCGACGQAAAEYEVWHSFYTTQAYVYDETHHWKVCIDCGGKAVYNEHVVEEDGTCFCGATGLALPCDHEFELVAVVEATCVEAGIGEVTCIHCGEVDGEEAIPALGHTTVEKITEATCTKAGVKESICEVCGEVVSSEAIPALGHDAVEKITEATCTEAGVKESICEVCGEVVSSEAIPALGHDAVEKITEATCTEAGVKESICEV